MNHGRTDFEDLDVFFDTDDFAIVAHLHISETLEDIDINGIFDTPYQKRDFGAFIVDEDAPSFTCKWDPRFDSVRKGDILTIGDENIETFYIDSVPQHDGTGICAMILTRRSTQDAEGDEPHDSTDNPPPSGGLFGSNPGRR